MAAEEAERQQKTLDVPAYPPEQLPEETQQQSLLMRLEKAEQQKIRESMQTGALREFIDLFENSKQGKAKKQAALWMNFFLSEDFLREQFSEEFGRGMSEYLKQQSVYPADNLPAGFLLELAVAYAFVPYYAGAEYFPGKVYPKEWYKVDVAEGFPARRYAAEIWNMQGVECDLKSVTRQLGRPDNRVRHHSFEDYLILKMMHRKGLLTEQEKSKWTGILDCGCVHRFYERNGKNPGSGSYESRSECLIKLYTQWLRDEQLPACVLKYIYKTYKFKDLAHSSTRGLYAPLKEEVEKQFPDIEQELYGDGSLEQKITRFYAAAMQIINDNHTNYVNDIYGDTEEIKARVQALFAMPEWSELKNNPALFDRMYRDLFRRVMPESLAKILIAHYSAPEWPDPKRGAVVVERLLRSLSTNRMMRERDWRQVVPYEKTDVRDIDEKNADFWQYFFSYGYGFRYVLLNERSEKEEEYEVGHACALPIYIRYLYDPSVEWQKRFTGYDEEEEAIKTPVSVSCKLPDGRMLRLEFHLHYILYFLDEAPVIAPVFDFAKLLEYEKEMESAALFFFVLAVTAITEQEQKEAEILIGRWLEKLPFYPAVRPFLAKLLAADNDRLPEADRVQAVFYEEQERFCFRAVVSQQGVRLYRQVTYGWEDQIFRAKEFGWIPVPLFEEEIEQVKGADIEEKKQFAKEKLKQLKQPKPVKLDSFSLEGMEDKEKMVRILEAMKQQESVRLKGRRNHLHQTDVSWNPEQLNEKYDKFVKEYGCLLTESYCVLHYGTQKGKRYEKLLYSALRPYGFQLSAHSGEYVSSVEFEERSLKTKIKEKCVLLGRFGWGYKYSPKSNFNPRLIFLGESGTYYAHDGIRTLRETDFAALLARLFCKDLEGVTSVEIYEGYLSVSRLDHRLEYCYGEEDFLESVRSRQDGVTDYFTVFGRHPMWTEFEQWMDASLEQGIPEGTEEIWLHLVSTGGVGRKLELFGHNDKIGDMEDEEGLVPADTEIYRAQAPELVWKTAAYEYEVEEEVYLAMNWYTEHGTYAGELREREIGFGIQGFRRHENFCEL